MLMYHGFEHAIRTGGKNSTAEIVRSEPAPNCRKLGIMPLVGWNIEFSGNIPYNYSTV